MDDMAAKYYSTAARIALAWLVARPSITAPIVSAPNLEQSIEILNQASA